MSARRKGSKTAVAVNAAANWVGFASQLAVAFFLTPLLVHGLGDRHYGIWSLVESVIAYLTLFDLGLAASLVRYVARFGAQEDEDGLNRVFNTTVAAFALAGASALVIALVLAFPWERPLGVPTDMAEDTRWLLVLLGGKLAIGLPMSAFAAVLDGLELFVAKTAVRTCGLLVRTALTLAVLWAGYGLVGIVSVVVAVTAAEDLALGLLVRRNLPTLRFRPALADRATFRLIRGYSLNAFTAMVAGRISFQTDALVIGAFLPPEYITFFAISARLVEYSKSSMRAVTTVLTPTVSAMQARGDSAAIRRVLIDGTRYVLYLILPVQTGLLTLGHPFLTLWVGPDHARSGFSTLAILSLPLFLVISQSISGRILYGIGRLGWFAKASLCEAAANLALSLILVRSWGIEGVALGTVLPSFLFNLAVAIHTCRTLDVSLRTYFQNSFLKPLSLASPLLVGWWAAARWVHLSGWTALFVAGSLGAAAYCVAAALAEYGPADLVRRLRSSGARPSGATAGPVGARSTTADT